MAQDVRKNKKTTHTGGSNALRNPLSGLVYCSGCHSLMTRQVSNTKAKYAILRCPNSKCKTVSSPIYLIEKKVIDGLREWAARYELEWEEEPQEDTSSALSLLSNSAKTLKAKRQQIRQQLSSTYDLLEQGVYTLSVFQERRKLLEEKQSGLDTELSRLLQQIEDIQLQEQAKREFLPAARRIIDSYWDTDDMETRNSMLKEVLDHIDYSRTERTKKGLRDTATFELHFYPRLPENR